MKLSHTQKAYKMLRNKLLVGELPLGTKLNDTELAKDMGISRTPVREAVIRLSNEGFCHQIPRMGTYVRIPDDQELSEMFELRVVLESHAVKKAALQATSQDIEELEALCEVLREEAVRVRNTREEEDRSLEWQKKVTIADVKFHLSIVRIGGNRRFLKIIDDLAIMSTMCSFGDVGRQFEGKSKLKEAVDTYAGHKRIVNALKKKSPELALDALLRHLVPPSPRGGKQRFLAAQHAIQSNRTQDHAELQKTIRDLEAINNYKLLNI